MATRKVTKTKAEQAVKVIEKKMIKIKPGKSSTQDKPTKQIKKEVAKPAKAAAASKKAVPVSKKVAAAPKVQQKKTITKKPVIVKKAAPAKNEKKAETPKKQDQTIQIVVEKEENKEEDENDWKDAALPGQKNQTPEEGNPYRIFYESLLQQNPKSAMAEKWCLENGLLDPQKALKITRKHEKTTKK